MNRHILEKNVYYYEDGIQNFKEIMNTLNELEKSKDLNFWQGWTSSNDKNFIYGETMPFDKDSISSLDDVYRDKMMFIYENIIKSMYDICKDYALDHGDFDEPNLFPVFNIKKYNTGMSMGAHFDQLDGDKTLRYSLVLYLNDDCEGGEISFKIVDYEGILHQSSPELDYNEAVINKSIDFGIKPKAGSIIIFPSSAPYHHTAHLVKKGFKYMIPGHWIHNLMNK